MLNLALLIVTTGRWKVNFSYTTFARFQVLVALCSRIQAFWDVTLCVWLWSLDPWRWRQYVPSKRRWPPSQRHSVLSQKVCLLKNAAEYTGTFSDVMKETGETFVMRSFMVCFPRRMIKSGIKMSGVRGSHAIEDVWIQSFR